MTIEEAIRDMKECVQPVIGGIAVDMAIKALEHELTAPKWISVNDALPTEKIKTWIWDGQEVNFDYWDDDRGKKHLWVDEDGNARESIASGWYYATDNPNITHWMPINRPEPPKDGE